MIGGLHIMTSGEIIMIEGLSMICIGTIMIEPCAIRTTEDTTCRMSSTRGPPGMVMAVFKALALDNVCS